MICKCHSAKTQLSDFSQTKETIFFQILPVLIDAFLFLIL